MAKFKHFLGKKRSTKARGQHKRVKKMESVEVARGILNTILDKVDIEITQQNTKFCKQLVQQILESTFREVEKKTCIVTPSTSGASRVFVAEHLQKSPSCSSDSASLSSPILLTTTPKKRKLLPSRSEMEEDKDDIEEVILQAHQLEEERTNQHPLEIELINVNPVLHGRRIVDINYFLNKALTVQIWHNKNCTGGRLQVAREHHDGLKNVIVLKCNICNKEMTICTEDPNEPTSVVNKAAVWGTLSTGSTYTHLAELFSVLDIPVMSEKKFYELQREMSKVWQDSLWKLMKETGNEEREAAIKAGEIDAQGTPCITVYLDGGWSKRSYGHTYNALSGLAVIIGKRTGKLLFVGVRNKYCSICARAENNNDTPKEHLCFKNWSSSSTSMEQDIIVEGFNNSILMHGLKYIKFIADGDSTVLSKIREKGFYGMEVTKSECINHVIKNFGKHLHKVKLDTKGVSLEARKLLTTKRIDQLVKSVQAAIYANTHDANSLKQDIRNCVNHVFGSHFSCKDYLCNTVGDMTNDETERLVATGLHHHVYSSMNMLLTKADLLLDKETNNRAELFMSLNSRFNMGKRLNLVQRDSYEIRSTLTGLKYNEGPSWHYRPWKDMFLKSPGKTLTKFMTAQTKKNIYKREHPWSRKRTATRKLKFPTKDSTADYGPNIAEVELEGEELQKEIENLCNRLQVTLEEQQAIAKKTVGQFENPVYISEKLHRLTASNFGAVIKRKKTTSCHALVAKILSRKYFTTPATAYGRANEAVAISKFSEKTGKLVSSSGLYADLNFGFLGASPDGIINNDEIVEAKCLHKIVEQKTTLMEAVKKHQVPCLNLENGEITLKTNHDYYYQLKNNVVNLYLQQNNLLITYNHLIIYKWIWSNFLKKFRNTPKPKGVRAKTVYFDSKRYSMLEEIIRNISINFCAEISNIVAVIRFKNDKSSSIGVNKVRLMLDQVQECRGNKYESYLANLLLSDRHWQTELLIESLWWSFKEWNHDTNVSKVLHVWGTPVYLGMGLIKFCTSEDEGLKLYSLLDTVQLEWSLKLADYAILALKSFLSYQFKIKPFFKQQPAESSSDTKLTTSIVITHFNCFLQSQNNEYFVSRLDTISIDTNKDVLSFKFEDFKLFTLNNSGDYYSCIRTEDILNYKVFIKILHLDYCTKEDAVEYNISVLDSSVAFWSTNFHLKALLLHRDISEFCTNFIGKLPRIKKPQNIHPSTLPVKIINCNIFGKVELHIDISKDHTAKIVLDEVLLSNHRHWHPDKKDFNHSISNVTIAIDGAETFEIKGVSFKLLFQQQLEAQKIQMERKENKFIQPFNKFSTRLLQIDLFKIAFSHEHNYAEAIQNQLLSVIKWLKIIHITEKDDDPYKLNLMPADWLINVKEFLFEMSDDPFEVKLRDNFELLEDEYKESLKRLKMLKEKIAELGKTHLHMPAAKMEELYTTLKKRNADIYIQRSKLMYQAAPQRTRLFAWHMTNVDLMIMIDIQPDVVGTIRGMDKESPWPEENMEFSTKGYRHINLKCAEWKFQLRDFPQPLLEIKKMHLCGVLVVAEQVAPKRATRTVMVDLGEPFEPFEVERGMQPLKYYYDLNCEIESFSYAFGPCWEPVIAQCNLGFNQISAPSRDPSPPLTFWDKVRLLMHGRFTMVVQQLQVLLHASLDPYNTTEEMALTWEKVVMDWTNAKLIFIGDLNVFVRTASKYDDVQLLKLPNLKLILGFHWVCLADPNDHHSVIFCAPDKIPEYSSNQVHDSFRAFRSQNLNLSIVLETKPSTDQSPNSCPILLLYGSTLRWIESLKLILSGVTRPTKRGKIFNNLRPRKPQLSRHYKKVNLLVGLHKFQVCYWMSFAMHRGCELFGGRLSSSSEHSLSLVAIDDGLKHRPKAEWSIVYMNSELTDSEIWLKSALQDESEIETSRLQPVEKTYCLSVAKVSYGREAVFPNQSTTERNRDTPTHRLVVYDLRGAWTKSNRNVALALFDTFMKTTRMKKNLSTESLKGFRKDTNTTPMKRRGTDPTNTPPNNAIQAIQTASAVQDNQSPISKLQSGHAANMLQQLIAEADNNSIVYSDDLSAVSRQQHLQGLQACQEDDVVHKNWQISLVNAQVLLKGCETNGYVILSAAKAEILQRVHRPAWKDRTLVSKTTWTGLLECMQYYATVNAGENDANENIMWLTVDNIQEKESAEISEPSEVPNIVGSGVSVGAVVTDTVGPSTSRQLQRIVSRCKCEFFYVGYGDISTNPEGEIPPPPPEDVSPWDSRQTGVDAFTLMHYDLDVCTNSLQYAMLLDIINNLLLYVEPHRKEALEKLARMRFQLQLYSVEDQRRPIQGKQTIVRNIMNKLRRLEKDTYMVNKALEENPDDMELRQELDRLERLMHDCKMNLNAQSDELDMMLSCYKETQLLASARIASTRSDKPLTIVRANEICFKHAQWRLTEADGQIGIADLVLSNFLYTKNSKSDDSVEHLLELGYLRMTNLIPNDIYKDVLCPTEIQFDMPIEHKKVLRIFCREKPPVGGISVKEHFEINLVPLTIGLTKKFFVTMMKFSFPERDTESSDYNDRASEDGDTEGKNKKGKGKKNRDSNFYVHIDEVEKMKERAEKNKLFVYIKIPEVPVKASYKGTKEKNLEDLRDVSIVIPTLEYHNMTWTWLDLLMAIINDTKKVILSQAIKQKLQIKRNTGTGEDSSVPQEEDKAKMLLGSRHHKMKNVGEKAPENKSIRKGVSGVFSLGK